MQWSSVQWSSVALSNKSCMNDRALVYNSLSTINCLQLILKSSLWHYTVGNVIHHTLYIKHYKLYATQYNINGIRCIIPFQRSLQEFLIQLH